MDRAFDLRTRADPAHESSADQVQKDGTFVIEGNLFDGGEATTGKIVSYGLGTRDPRANAVGATAALENGQTLIVREDGGYTLTSPTAFTEERGQRVSIVKAVPPDFTTENYETVLFSEGIGRSFLNSLTVTIPATIIPILIAAFAAYALAWMHLPGRGFIIAVIVGLLVVPLQMSLIPLLKLYNTAGEALGISAKGYLGIWLAHTGFGLPFAIYLLRSYIAGLPKDLIESAKVDGANDFRIFTRIILPLSFPALASFAIFQFLWVWNDLLVAMIFLGNDNEQLVLTGRLNALLGSRGGNWEILTASALHHDHRSADRVLLASTVLCPRPARGFGQGRLIMADITITRLNKSYGQVHILKDVDLKISSGEFMVFVGPSGCASPPCCAQSAALNRSPPARSRSPAPWSTMCRPPNATSPWSSSPTRFILT